MSKLLDKLAVADAEAEAVRAEKVHQRFLEARRLTAVKICAKATELVGGDRERVHGEKRVNFEATAALWNAWLTIRRDPSAPLDGHDVGQMMSLMKKARTQSGTFNPDDWIDDAGYSGCAGEVASDMKIEAEEAA